MSRLLKAGGSQQRDDSTMCEACSDIQHIYCSLFSFGGSVFLLL